MSSSDGLVMTVYQTSTEDSQRSNPDLAKDKNLKLIVTNN